jgi:hypothetical protein
MGSTVRGDAAGGFVETLAGRWGNCLSRQGHFAFRTEVRPER